MSTLRILGAGALMAILSSGPAPAADQLGKFDGEPAFSPGFDFGYYVWRSGDTWHVRWTTQGKLRRFHGSVIADSGKLKSLKRIDVEKESRVVRRGRAPRVVRGPRGRAVGVRSGRPPVVATKTQDKIEKDGDQKIWFSAKTDADIDGFNFKAGKNVQTLRFVLEIDGKSRVRFVRLGEEETHPSGNPFEVSLH